MAQTNPIPDAQTPSSPLSVPASKTALLICDFHTFLIGSMPPEGQAALKTATAMREWARNQNITIVHCLIDMNVSILPQIKMAARATQVQSMAKDSGPEFAGEVAEIAARPGEYVFWRPLGCISILSSYGLNDFFKRHDIQSIMIAGVATSGCVLDTAKAASEVGMIVSVVEDACADRLVETHEFITRKLLVNQCHVATMNQFVEAWK